MYLYIFYVSAWIQWLILTSQFEPKSSDFKKNGKILQWTSTDCRSLLDNEVHCSISNSHRLHGFTGDHPVSLVNLRWGEGEYTLNKVWLLIAVEIDSAGKHSSRGRYRELLPYSTLVIGAELGSSIRWDFKQFPV